MSGNILDVSVTQDADKSTAPTSGSILSANFSAENVSLCGLGGWCGDSPAEGELSIAGERSNASVPVVEAFYKPSCAIVDKHAAKSTSFTAHTLPSEICAEATKAVKVTQQSVTRSSSASPRTKNFIPSLPDAIARFKQTKANIESTPKLPPRCNICICGQSFKTADALERHAKAAFHRLYVCTERDCDKSYYRRDVFVRHMATHKHGSSHECWACSMNGLQRSFSRKDHLTQHIKNCHRDIDLQQLDLECMSWPPPAWNVNFDFEPPSRCDSPFNYTTSSHEIVDPSLLDYRSQRDERVQPLVAVNNDKVGGARHKYQSRAVADLECAFDSIVGQDPEQLQILKEQLNLHDGLTTEQLAVKLRDLLIPLMPYTHGVNGVSTGKPPKRRVMV